MNSFWNKKTGGVAGSLAIILALLTACGGNDGGKATVTPSATPAAASAATPTKTPSGPTATPSTTEAPMILDEFVIKPGLTRAPYGTVIFKVRNEGELTHQFLVIRSDLPIAGLPRRADGLGADETTLDIVGKIDSIAPGGEDQLSVYLDPGQYVVICNLNDGTKSHYLTGMYNQFTVVVPE